ncbi:MAG: sodium ion-translocating decarboxylase subunit beta, partial [Gammaproteobacteria bacterium]|nr:sodium ion-translocating decarboxylase subunit beta [Gammaproteobacteria bacterium]
MDGLIKLWNDTGIANFTFGQAIMIFIGLGLLYLAIAKKFEPLLLVTIGFGGILANIPNAGLPLDAVENAVASGQYEIMQQLAEVFKVSLTTPTELLKHYNNADQAQHLMALQLARDAGFE